MGCSHPHRAYDTQSVPPNEGGRRSVKACEHRILKLFLSIMRSVYGLELFASINLPLSYRKASEVLQTKEDKRYCADNDAFVTFLRLVLCGEPHSGLS